MHVISDHIDLKQIAGSGQCFRWKAEEDGYSVIAFGKHVTMSQREDGLEISCSDEEWSGIFAPYFDMSTDYNRIESLINASNDGHLAEAFAIGKGIRILRQDLWEVIVSFLISQNNNIPRIKGSVEALCRAGGLRVEGYDDEYCFPNPSDLDPAIFDSINLGLGYRAQYLKDMYFFASKNPEWLSYLKTLDYQAAREELMSLKGIGPKVADCVCLFGLHHIDAFPVDTHVKSLLSKYYPDGFDFGYFEGCAGVIQQYLFFYELINSKK